MSLSLDIGAREEWRRHWPVVVAGAAGMALASVSAYSTGIMIRPLEEEFGWTRAAISSGPLIPSVAAVLLGPFIGLAVDRFGPRRLGIIGVFLACSTIAMLSLASSALWTWWALWALMAFSGMFTKPMIWTAGVSSLFASGRGLALAVTLCGTALCSTLTPLLANYLVDTYGWRIAYLGLGAFWAIIVLPPVLVLFTSASDKYRTAGAKAGPSAARRAPRPVLPGVTAREGLTSWRFVRLAIASVTMVVATVAFVVTLVPILVSTGQPRATAAGLAGLIGITTVVGRLAGGYLLDRLNGNLVAAVSIAMPILSCLLLLSMPGSLPVAVAAAMILGFSLGAELDAVAYLTTRHFGMRSFGVLFGTIGGLQALGTGVGPLLVNHIYDVTRSYTLALWLFIPVCLLGSALFLSLGRYPEFPPIEIDEEPAPEPTAN